MKSTQPYYLLLLVACSWFGCLPAQSGELPALVTNGHGIRRILFFDVYEMVLRTTQPMHRAEEVLTDTAHQEILLHMLRDASADQFIEAIADGVQENQADTPEVHPLLEQLYVAIRAKGRAPQGSVVRIFWDGLSTSFFLDDHCLLTTPGLALRNALLLVWLGAKPVDAPLKVGLLGAR